MNNFKRHLGALAAGIGATALLAGIAMADPAVLYDGGGGKNDKSFNEATFNGAEQYKKETGGSYGEFQISADAQREQAIRQFADKGYSPIVLPGFSWETALKTVAPDYPDIDFVIIDTVVDLPNVRSVTFKEQEGSYLVGGVADPGAVLPIEPHPVDREALRNYLVAVHDEQAPTMMCVLVAAALVGHPNAAARGRTQLNRLSGQQRDATDPA